MIARWRAREPRLRVAAQDSGGISRCANLAASMARAPFLARLDADDIALPQRLDQQLAVMEGMQELAVLGSAIACINAAGETVFVRHYPQTRSAAQDDGAREAVLAFYAGAGAAIGQGCVTIAVLPQQHRPWRPSPARQVLDRSQEAMRCPGSMRAAGNSAGAGAHA